MYVYKQIFLKPFLGGKKKHGAAIACLDIEDLSLYNI
jgi:hypothetical protein